MSRTTSSAAALAAAALFSAGLAAAPASAQPLGAGPQQQHRPHPATSRYVDVQLLAVNDFHGNLEPPTGSSGRVVVGSQDGKDVTVDAGGAEYLATHVERLRADRAEEHSVMLSTGDNVGASPLLSALFHDEPTIEFLNRLDTFASATGNHEYDEGITELQRLQRGGCHPVDGCAGGRTFEGADFTYLSANVTDERTGRLVMPAYAVKRLERNLSIGFIGMPLKETPSVVTASGVAGLRFGDEVAATDRAVRALRKRGVRSIVLLLHQGDNTEQGARPNSCSTVAGPARAIAEKVDAEVDAIFTAHSHQQYVCEVTDPRGKNRPVVQGASFGRLVSEIDLTIDRRTRDVVRNRTVAENHIVTRDVPKDPATTALVERYRTLAGPIISRPVGTTTAAIGRAQEVDESPLGNLIADAQLAATSAADQGGAQIAFMNPGGVRADLDAGPVTYGEAFAVQPFNNTLVTLSLTGARIRTLLEQQFNNSVAGSTRFLSPSRGFTYGYAWSRSGPATITDMTLNGAPVQDATTYRVTVNSFLADGGDNFAVLREGTDRLVGGLDIDAFVAYLTATDPVAPPATDRVTKVG